LEADKITELSGSHFCYRVYGLTLISDIRFPELIASPQGATAPVVRVRLRSETRVAEPLRWFDSSTLANGEPWLSCAKVNGGYFFRYHNFADFLVDRTGCEIVLAQRRSGISLFTLRHLILDQTLPLVLNLLGRDAIHATAVITPHGACAFIGPAGSGKSTLAASFLVAGYPVMGDDCVVLQQRDARVFATPAYPGLRLWNDAFEAVARDSERPIAVAEYTSKARLLGPRALRNFPEEPQPLAGIYRLVREPAPSLGNEAGCVPSGPSPALSREKDGMRVSARDGSRIEHLPPREAFFELLASAFPLDKTDHAMLRRQFRFFERVLARVPVKKLVLSDDFSALPAARDVVLADLRDGRSSEVTRGSPAVRCVRRDEAPIAIGRFRTRTR
jgi:hypothetical protein